MMPRWTHLLLAMVALAATSSRRRRCRQSRRRSHRTDQSLRRRHPTEHRDCICLRHRRGADREILLRRANKSTPVVTGFPQADALSSKEPTYSVGPLGLVFLNQNTLIVGEGALKQGDEVIRVFELPADGKPLNLDDAKQKLGPLSASDSKARKERAISLGCR